MDYQPQTQLVGVMIPIKRVSISDIPRCHKCGKVFDYWDIQEDFRWAPGHIGYGSHWDGFKVNIRLCCDCADTLMDWLVPQLEDKSGIREYDI